MVYENLDRLFISSSLKNHLLPIMIADQIARKKQQEDERRARRWASLILLLLLIFFVFPFVTGKITAKQRFERVVEVQFEKPPQAFKQASASQRSSTRASSALKESPVETPPPTATPEPTKTQPVEKPQDQPKPKPMEKITPLKTNSKPTLITAPTSDLKLDIRELSGPISPNAQVSQVNAQMVEVMEEIDEDEEDNISDFFSKQDGDGGGKVTDAPANGASSDGGEGDSGSSDSGDSDTDGQGDSGNGGDDFDGNGLLTRKVIKRANVTGIIRQTGKIVINLCVNREGKVIFAEADPYKSTINDQALLQKAENTAARYRYEKDYTVAERQCGKLSFILKIEE